MDPEQNEIKPEIKKTTRGFHLTWWLWVILIVAVVAIAAVLILKFTANSSGATKSIKTKPDTTEEITIKQYLSSLRGDIVRYGEDKKTFEGWTPNATAVTEVKKAGSELKTQALTKDTYIIFAKMPSSKLTFCLDNSGTSGFTGEVKSLSSKATTCK